MTTPMTCQLGIYDLYSTIAPLFHPQRVAIVELLFTPFNKCTNIDLSVFLFLQI